MERGDLVIEGVTQCDLVLLVRDKCMTNTSEIHIGLIHWKAVHVKLEKLMSN
jgi:hypothetical protein